jgi:hypothetical protein
MLPRETVGDGGPKRIVAVELGRHPDGVHVREDHYYEPDGDEQHLDVPLVDRGEPYHPRVEPVADLVFDLIKGDAGLFELGKQSSPQR